MLSAVLMLLTNGSKQAGAPVPDWHPKLIKFGEIAKRYNPHFLSLIPGPGRLQPSVAEFLWIPRGLGMKPRRAMAMRWMVKGSEVILIQARAERAEAYDVMNIVRAGGFFRIQYIPGETTERYGYHAGSAYLFVGPYPTVNSLSRCLKELPLVRLRTTD